MNLLINAPFIDINQAAAMGVRRISVGGTLARTAREIADSGTFTRNENGLLSPGG